VSAVVGKEGPYRLGFSGLSAICGEEIAAPAFAVDVGSGEVQLHLKLDSRAHGETL